MQKEENLKIAATSVTAIPTTYNKPQTLFDQTY